MSTISRRDLMAGTAAAALAAAASQDAEAQPALPAGAPKQVSYTLDCGFITLNPQDFEGLQIRARAYNKTIPGTLMEVHPGQTLVITMKNSLPVYSLKFWPVDPKAGDWPGDHNVPHNFGATNLHLHGMDIMPHLFAPLGTSNPSAPMIDIQPGGSLVYTFKIPDNHPPGFNWYHPHHHGSTAVQAASGMAGGIVVKGAIDEVPTIKAARDIPLVIQDLGLFQVDKGLDPAALGLPAGTDISNYWTYLPRQNAIWQTFSAVDGKPVDKLVTYYDPTKPAGQQYIPTDLNGGFTTGDYALRYYLLNGKPFFKETHNPANPTDPTATQMTPQTITMQPGEVVRFRMLNGNSDNYMPIVVENHEMHLLALDGVNFDRVRTIPVAPINTDPKNEGQIQLAPANRAEFMIKAGQPGTYRIVQLQQKQQFLVSAQKTIAVIEVKGEPKDMKLPTTLPPQRRYPIVSDKEVERLQVIFFADQFPGTQNPYVGIDFLLNGQQYSETTVNYVVNVDSVEEWHLVVGDPQHGGTEGHPFHIHVNPFEVISINGVKQPPGTFKDTIWIPAESTVVIRNRFKEFVGKTVFHCHILPHEDTGMMQNFLIKRRNQPLPPEMFRTAAPARLRPVAQGYVQPMKMDMPGHGGSQ